MAVVSCAFAFQTADRFRRVHIFWRSQDGRANGYVPQRPGRSRASSDVDFYVLPEYSAAVGRGSDCQYHGLRRVGHSD